MRPDTFGPERHAARASARLRLDRHQGFPRSLRHPRPDPVDARRTSPGHPLASLHRLQARSRPGTSSASSAPSAGSRGCCGRSSLMAPPSAPLEDSYHESYAWPGAAPPGMRPVFAAAMKNSAITPTAKAVAPNWCAHRSQPLRTALEKWPERCSRPALQPKTETPRAGT
jgi:hypothetical protein